MTLNWEKLDDFQGIAWGIAVGDEVRGVIGEGSQCRSPEKDFTFQLSDTGCYWRVLSRGITWSDLHF